MAGFPKFKAEEDPVDLLKGSGNEAVKAEMIGAAPRLQARITSLTYPGKLTPALVDIDLSFYPGEFILLAGAPGSGKTSLCQCLAGVIPLFIPADLTGEISYESRQLAQWKLPEIAGKIGLVREDPQHQLFCTSVEDDLAFGPCNLLEEREEVRRRAAKALDFVGLLGYEKRKPETLSGGEAQRAALAAALTLAPNVIIMDGAAHQLDPQSKKEIYLKLQSLCLTGKKTVILVEKNAGEFIGLATRLIVLDQGKAIYDGKPSAAILPKAKQTKKIYPTGEKELGKAAGNLVQPLIRVEELSFQYPGGNFGLKQVNLDIYPGEFVAVVGQNGAGKTTLVKHFNGLLRPDGGTVLVNGLNTRDHTLAGLAAQVGYLFQNPHLQVCTGSVEAEAGFALKVRKVPAGEIKKRVAQILEKIGLAEQSLLHPYRLAQGQLQKLALASSLITNPTVLVIDEPTSQMSLEESWQTMELVSEFNRQGGTVVMVTHDLKLALKFSHRLVAMKEGQVVLDISTNNYLDYLDRLAGFGVDVREEGGIAGEIITGV